MAPVTITVDCDHGTHRVTWRRGRLHLHDHDIAAERALAALGSPPCACLEILDVWRAPVDRRELLWAATAPVPHPAGESLSELRASHEEVVTRWTKGHATRASAFRTYLQRRWQQSLVSVAPLSLRDRLAAALIVGALRQQVDGDGLRDELPGQLETRAVPAVVASIAAWQRAPRRHGLVCECWPVDDDDDPVVCGLVDDSGGWVGVGLPARWLVDVWARDIPLVDGCLILSASVREATVLDVVAVRWERLGRDGAVTPVVGPGVAFRTDDRHWHLRWTTSKTA